MRKTKTGMKGFTLPIILSAATVLLSVAQVSIAHAHSVNDSVLKIERVEQRVKSIDIIVNNAAKSLATESNADLSQAEQILRPIVTKAFAYQPVMDDLRKALGNDDADGEALYAVAGRLEDSRKQIDKIFADKDDAKIQELETRLKQNQAQVEELAKLMAGQDLSSETAFLGESIRLTLKSYLPEDRSAFRNKSPEELKRSAVDGLEKLHSDGVTEGPFDQRLARHSEQVGTVLALINLPESDLKTLSDFYNSEQGKDKTKALVEKFDELSLKASKEIMLDYWQKISADLKN